jgi:hypothetical protein
MDHPKSNLVKGTGRFKEQQTDADGSKDDERFG